MQNEIACCFTGYRPEKFNFDLLEENSEYIQFQDKLLTTVFDIIDSEKVNTFYCGGARGFDIIAAEIVLLLKKKRDIKLKMIIPFKNFANGLGVWRERYENIIKNADEVIYIQEEYSLSSFNKRNRYMIERSLIVLTFFDGKSGGTKNTIEYAQKNGRHIINLALTDPLAELKNKKRIIYRVRKA